VCLFPGTLFLAYWAACLPEVCLACWGDFKISYGRGRSRPLLSCCIHVNTSCWPCTVRPSAACMLYNATNICTGFRHLQVPACFNSSLSLHAGPERFALGSGRSGSILYQSSLLPLKSVSGIYAAVLQHSADDMLCRDCICSPCLHA
jgi:hypothetical protein